MRPRQYCAIAIALVAGCNFSHGNYAEQKDAAGDGPLIDGPPIDGTPIDAPPDTPPPDPDNDGDGVLDSVDNCPAIANTNQRNHDGDAKGDACDGCPHLMSATEPDGDGDGVGDACDPRPGTAGDQIALFEGFYDANATTGWTETGNGTWSVANGVLTQSSTTSSTTTHTLGPTLNVPRAAVTAGAKLITVGNGNGFSAPHVAVASGVAPNQSYWCALVDDGNIYATIVRPGMPTQYPNASWSGSFAANTQVKLTSALLGTENRCNVVEGATAMANASGTTGATPGLVHVGTRSASASFDYLFVVSIGN